MAKRRIGDEMTLDEFLDLLRRDIKDFESFWFTERRKKPDKFPLEMSEGDWYWRFNAWGGT